jgi:hypothetical protein
MVGTLYVIPVDPAHKVEPPELVIVPAATGAAGIPIGNMDGAPVPHAPSTPCTTICPLVKLDATLIVTELVPDPDAKVKPLDGLQAIELVLVIGSTL